MVIVKWIEERVFTVGDEPIVRWYVCKDTGEACKCVKEEESKIENYNKMDDKILHRKGNYELLTPEKVKGRMLCDIDTMSVGMLCKIMSHK